MLSCLRAESPREEQSRRSALVDEKVPLQVGGPACGMSEEKAAAPCLG